LKTVESSRARAVWRWVAFAFAVIAWVASATVLYQVYSTHVRVEGTCRTQLRGN
jgi:hypothetical protein